MLKLTLLLASMMTVTLALIGDFLKGKERTAFIGLRGAFVGLGGVFFIVVAVFSHYLIIADQKSFLLAFLFINSVGIIIHRNKTKLEMTIPEAVPKNF